MSKAIVLLMGGLGNQMFQTAYAYSIKKAYSDVVLDTTFLNKNNKESDIFTPRTLELEIFECVKKTFNIKMLGAYVPIRIYMKLLSYLNNYSEKINIGYYQSDKFFKNNRNEILQLFKFDESLLSKETINLVESIRDKRVLSIHVRRGDYLKSAHLQSIHGVCSIEFYKKAYAYLCGVYSFDRVFIFSDEPEWVESNFEFIENMYVVKHNSGKDSFQDMYIMTKCHSHIIANSSFSWWGAWLSTQGGGVVAPQQWYAGQDLYNKEIYCSGWTVL